jgi:hypothetical protein
VFKCVLMSGTVDGGSTSTARDRSSQAVHSSAFFGALMVLIHSTILRSRQSLHRCPVRVHVKLL